MSIEDTNDLDRGMPSVSEQENKSGLVQLIVVVVITCIVVVLLIAVNGGFSKSEEEIKAPRKNDNVRNILGEAPDALVEPVVAPVAVPRPPISTKQAALPPAKVVAKQRSGKRELTPEERKMQSAAVTQVKGNSGSKQSAREQALEAEVNFLKGSDKADGLAAQLQPTKVKGGRAGLLVDRNMFITQGTFVDCALETAISSDLAGMISCRMTRDVYSTSGKVLLLERGSRIVGQYKGGLTKGKARIFAIWNRVETPTGVLIDLASPGTGPLGRAGHGGFVDTHFWKRFGGAILLSVIDDVGNYISAQANDSDSISFGGTSDAAESTTSIALKNSINIPPTLHKNQGEHINVFVARDLDFRGVYDLEPTE